MATALQLDEDAKCAGCGQYRDESMTDDMDGWYEAETIVCHGCAAKDRHQDDRRGKDPEPGELVYVVNTRHDQ